MRRAKGTGAFQRVAEVVGSGDLPKAVEFGALWCSLPDLAWSGLPDPEWPMAAYVWEGPEGRARGLRTDVRAAVGLHTSDWSEENVERLMSNYPSATGWTHAPSQAVGTHAPAQAVDPFLVFTPQGNGVQVSWPRQLEPEGDVRTLDEIAPAHRFQGERWLQPTLGEKGTPVAPMMRWWALLYGLSTLARYEPAKWTRDLRIDSSALAVRLEDGLDEALNAIPHLVLEALVRGPVLLQRHSPAGEV